MTDTLDSTARETRAADYAFVEAFIVRSYGRLESPRARGRAANPDALPWMKGESLSPWRPTSAWGKRRLREHLEAHYDLKVTKIRELVPTVFRLAHSSGPDWVTRTFGPGRPLEATEGDAAILRFLEERDFPSERCATEEPVSQVDGHAVLITEFLEGTEGAHTGRQLNELGRLFGRLHTLPEPIGVAARSGGSYHLATVEGGGRPADVETLQPLLRATRSLVPREHRPMCDALIAALDRVDPCDDLPRSLIHIDFGGPNVIATTDGLVPIDWTGTGLGPRVFGIGPLGWGSNHKDLLHAFVAGYREHASLEPEELDRLGPALHVHGLILHCLTSVWSPDRLPRAVAAVEADLADCEAAADAAREAFAADRRVLAGWESSPDVAPTTGPYRALVDAVVGKTDAEIDALASALGGYKQLCGAVFAGFRTMLKPSDCHVAFVLDDTMGWVVKAVGGELSTVTRLAKRAPLIVRTSSPEFLRLITRDLDWQVAIEQKRVALDGDRSQLSLLFGIPMSDGFDSATPTGSTSGRSTGSQP